MPVTWAIDRGDGPVGVGIDVVVPAASTIKVLIGLVFWQRAVGGEIDAAEQVADIPPIGDGSILDHLPGLRPTLAHLATLMLVVSDNAATNVLVERLGFGAVNEEARRLGLTRTALRRLMCDWGAADAGRDNTTTAGDLARLCRLLAPGGTLEPHVSTPVLQALAGSEHRDLLAEVVREGRLRGNKRGTNDRAEHDCGLVLDASGEPVGVAVCSSPPAAPDALRRTVVAALRHRP